MPTQKFPDSKLYTRFLLIAALSGVLATTTVAQGRDNSSSDPDGSNGTSISHKVDSSDRQGNRRGSSSAGSDKSTGTDQSGRDSIYQQGSQSSETGNPAGAKTGRKPTIDNQNPGQTTSRTNTWQSDSSNRNTTTGNGARQSNGTLDRSNRSKPSIDSQKPEVTSPRSNTWQNNTGNRNNSPTVGNRQSVDTKYGSSYGKPSIDSRKPEQSMSRSNTWQNNTDKRNNGPTIGNRQSFDTRDRSSYGRPSVDGRNSEQSMSRSDTWQNNTDKRNNGPSVTHKVTVDIRNRDYRDRVPAYSQDRDSNSNRPRGYKPPTFRDGRYSYSSRPNYQPSLFGYYAFNDDPGFCRSLYFYYGYFPYMDTVRTHRGSYIEVGYSGRPIVFGDDSDYYLSSQVNSDLDYALSDIRNSWLDGRADLIDNHVRDDQSIAVLLDRKYDYTIEANDYIQMTSDTIDQTRTVSFTWENVRKRNDGKYTAFGKHIYTDSEGSSKIVYVSYTLGRSGSDYFITEVGSSNRSLY